jgi:hypothetical protein
MDLEISEHPEFQRREWRFLRFGWAFIALFLLAGLLGLLGPGPLSWATAQSETGRVHVEYQRLVHLDTEDTLNVRIDGAAVTDDTITLTLDHGWAQAVEISGITPEPESETSGSEGLELEFNSTPGTPVLLQVRYQPNEMGSMRLDASVADETASFTQFVIP